MIKITEYKEIKCDDCLELKKTNKVEFGFYYFNLCDECLQELNRKILEHLAEKNI